MNYLDILSAEGMCAVIIVGSLALVVRSLLIFSRQHAEISPLLMDIEGEVTRLRSGMGDWKESVESLAIEVIPLGELEVRLRKYCDQLRDLELEYERSATKEAEEEAAETARRIKRRKLSGTHRLDLGGVRVDRTALPCRERGPAVHRAMRA